MPSGSRVRQASVNSQGSPPARPGCSQALPIDVPWSGHGGSDQPRSSRGRCRCRGEVALTEGPEADAASQPGDDARRQPDHDRQHAGCREPVGCAEDTQGQEDRPGDDGPDDREAEFLACDWKRPAHHGGREQAGQQEHQGQEEPVPGRVVHGRGPDGHGTQHGGQCDHAQKRENAPQARSEQDEQGQAADGVERHPLGGQRKPQDEAGADQEHHGRPGAPRAHVQRREEKGGQDEESRDIDVVHADPCVGKGHALSNDQGRGQHGDASPGEEDACQQVQQAGHQGPHEHPGQPPSEGVAVDAHPGQAPVRGDGQQVAAVLVGELRLRVGQQDGRLRGQGHVREHGVAVRLDHIDRGAACGSVAHGMDEVGRLVPGHGADRARHRQFVGQPRTTLQQRHDLKAIPGGGVERRFVESVADQCQGGDPRLGGHLGDEVEGPGVQDGDAAMVRHGQQGRRLDAHTGQVASVDGLLDPLQGILREVGVGDHEASRFEEPLKARHLPGGRFRGDCLVACPISRWACR